MVDNRSAGYFGVGGAFNFKSGDISGTAAKTQDDKMGPGTEYGMIGQEEEEQQQNSAPFVDRSAQLRATLNSLALMNVANVLNDKKRIELANQSAKSKAKSKTSVDSSVEREDLDEEFLNDFDNLQNDNEEDNEYY